MEIEFRQGKLEDLPQIMEMIQQAQAYFSAKGINQWQGGYPSQERIRQDIQEKAAWVLRIGEEIVASAAFFTAEEPSYQQIQGAWHTSSPYASIHRMAVREDWKGQGLAGRMLTQLEALAKERGMGVRIDTHRENLSMRRTLEKNGYQYCGIIYLVEPGPEQGQERLAYDYIC